MVWYYADKGSQRGPLTDEEFDALLKSGRLTKETLVWKDGMDNWTALSELPEGVLVASPPEASLTGSPESGAHGGFQHPGLYSQEPQVDCMQCGKSTVQREIVEHGNIKLCPACNAKMFGNSYGQNPYNAAPTGFPNSYGQQSQQPAYTQAVAVEYPSIWRRVAAKFLDSLIGTAIQIISVFAFKFEALKSYIAASGGSWEDTQAAAQEFAHEIRFISVGVLVFLLIYNTLLVRFFGATLGKMALSLRVIKSDGKNPEITQALTRAAIPVLLQLPSQVLTGNGSLFSLICLFILSYGYLIALFDPEKKTLYDRAAGTRVWHS